jgi:hyperosmotically inducible periplasmic protein
MRTALLICALAAAACGGSDNRPAQDPASVSETSATASTHADPNADPTPVAPVTPVATDGTATLETPIQGPQPAKSPVAVSPSRTSTVSGSNASIVGTNAGGVLVVDDPGAHDRTSNATNTKINDRDRHGALTPMNQGNSADETKITASIRKGLMGDSSLSFTAKNVKVITVGTKVTLRGPVNSDQEKSAIEARAKQTAGVTEVDDQLEVKK